jgi:hypothetical protein
MASSRAGVLAALLVVGPTSCVLLPTLGGPPPVADDELPGPQVAGPLVDLRGVIHCHSRLSHDSRGEPEEIEGSAQTDVPEADLLRAMRSRLQSDPAVADSLAARINRSKLAAKISAAPDEAARFAEIRRWIEADPESAAAFYCQPMKKLRFTYKRVGF